MSLQSIPQVIPHSNTLQDDVLQRLEGKLDNIHKDGKRLQSACPECGGKDRFFSGHKYQYNAWKCSNCGHTTTTSALQGLTLAQDQRPAVRSWQESEGPDAERIERIRELYHSLATFTHNELNQTAIDFLIGRGLTRETILHAQIGFLNAELYRRWYANLTPLQRANIPHAGLPELTDNGAFRGFAAMFAGGRQGKVVFPYCDQSGTVVDLRTRSISPHDSIGGNPIRYISPKLSPADRGASIPYGLDRLQATGTRIVLTEGELKGLIPWGMGFPYPVLSLRGTNDPVADYLDYFRGQLVVLAFDNDSDDKRSQRNGLTPGEAATITVGRLLRSHSVAVAIADPARMLDQKGLDDYVLKYGVDCLTELTKPGQTLSLTEYEHKLARRGADLSGFKMPKADPGVVRRWTPDAHVDEVAHAGQSTVTLEEAESQIIEGTRHHWESWQKGCNQLAITASTGVGKTKNTLDTAKAHALENDKTIAVFLPSHATIDEKIDDSTLEGFQHVYGRRWDIPHAGGPVPISLDWSSDSDEGIRNCKQTDLAHNLQRYGYSPGLLLCPTCEHAWECEDVGYKSQFKTPGNKAYTHGHLHTNFAEGEDLIIVDELTHKSFIDDMTIWEGDIINALAKGRISGAQRELLESLLKLFTEPDLGSMSGMELYEVIRRFYDNLDDVDAWGDGSSVQMSLNNIVLDSIKGISLYEAAELPQQFGEKLFTVLSDDVRSMLAGHQPSLRLRLEAGNGGKRWLVLTYSKGMLPAWYNKRPTVILNATGDHELLNMLVGPIDILSPIVDVAARTQVIQDVTRNNAKSSVVGDSDRAQQSRASWLAQIRSYIDTHGDESDTTIITTKALVSDVENAFPEAKVGYYHGLEGRNDLQSNLTILANSPPVSLDAVRREATALWPDADLTLTRRSVAFDVQNAGGELLAVEQVDAADKRVRALLWQHRDATVIQAVGRARLVREPGRTVVALFSRPIPGLKPTEAVTAHQTASATKHNTQDTVDKLVKAAMSILDDYEGFTMPTLTRAAGVSKNTVSNYWVDVTYKALGMQSIQIPVIQTLTTGGQRKTEINVALNSDGMQKLSLYASQSRYKESTITSLTYIQCLLPSSYVLDFDTLNSMFAHTSSPPVSTDSDTEGGPERAELDTYTGRRLTHTEMLEASKLARIARIKIEPVSLDMGGWWITAPRTETWPPTNYVGPAMWRNADNDLPLNITGYAGEFDGKRYFYTDYGTGGLLATELFLREAEVLI